MSIASAGVGKGQHTCREQVRCEKNPGGFFEWGQAPSPPYKCKTGGFSQTVKNEEFYRAKKYKRDSIIEFSREGRAYWFDYLIFLFFLFGFYWLFY
jgi:hypothetical protein